MLIDTKYLGKVQIEDEKIIQFESGLPGFNDETKFVILDIPGNELMQILQSIQTPDLAFIVTNPHYYYKNYTFKLDEPIIDSLNIQEEKNIVILAIMTIQEPFHLSTINLQAPIIINSKNKQAKQYILPYDQYEMKAAISFPMEEKGV
ncbi:flagellar assembly protein FliW [Pseudogracilibacillus sp. SE30717A]|uniref:flagellar assembly protein FliW n=1 Tax=Pseudogracilibacillus sp. SE30717A TaxID=3098293 RepID=UPI00300DE7B4